MVRSLCLAAALAVGSITIAAPAAFAAPARPVDYAAEVAGVWQGDVTSDSRGSSRTGVTITITRIGPNKIEIACDYARIPTVQMPLARYADSLQAASGPHVFLIELGRDPNRLDLSIDGASLVVRR